MKKFFRTFLAIALAGVFGCVSVDSDKVRFDRIAADLDAGGSCYFIGSSRHGGTAVEELIRKNEKELWRSELPSAVRFRLQRFISCSELLGRIAGLHEIKGWGGSSITLSGSKEPLFRNKFRLLLSRERKGVFWKFIPEKNLPLKKYLLNLPPDTFFAGVADLPLHDLSPLLKAEKKFSLPLTNICKLFLNMTLDEVLRSLSGVWRVVVVCDEENSTRTLEGIHIALTVPDKDNKLFKAFSSRLKYLPNTHINLKDGIIKLEKLQGRMCIPYLKKGKDTLSFYTSPMAAERTRDGNSFPQFSPALKDLARFTDLEGFGVFYSRSTAPQGNFSQKIDMEQQSPSLAVVKRLSDGFVIEDISSCDLNHYAVDLLTAFPVKLAFDFLSEQKTHKPRSQARPPRRPASRRSTAPAFSPQKKASAPAHKECLGAIKTLGKKLMADVSAAKKWPPHGIAGLRYLLEKKVISSTMLRCPEVRPQKTVLPGLSYANCHYLYFGKPGKNSSKTPVLMEFPFLHRRYFAVFYADGSVEKIHLDGRRNVRRAVSFLHTVHAYDETEFMRLMQRGAEFDKILER